MRKKRITLSRYWRPLSVTQKFAFAFGELLALMLLIVVTSYIALVAVRRQTSMAIVASAKIQPLVLEMDRNLQEARSLQRDFLLQYPQIGFEMAHQRYVGPTVQHIANVVEHTKRLKQYISGPEVNRALRNTNVNLNLYLSAAERYAQTFTELVELVTVMAEDETGLEARLARNSEQLAGLLQNGAETELMLLYLKMQSDEKDFLLNRQRPFMHSAFNLAFKLRQAVEDSKRLNSAHKSRAFALLDEHEAIAEEMLEVNVKIRSKFNDFELQAQTVNPISEALIALVGTEAERSNLQIGRTSMWATVILVVIGLCGVLLAGGTARLLNSSITHSVIELTHVARELQNGNLAIPVEIDSVDEIGHLADGFAAMRDAIQEKIAALHSEIAERKRVETEIRQLNEELEERVRQRTDELRKAKEHAEAANRAKSEFLSNMSHELRTPLNAVIGFSEILEQLLNSPQQRHYLTQIHSGGKTLLSLVNDVLDLSKIEAGKLELSYSVVSLSDLLRQMELIFKHRIKEKGLGWELDIDPNLPEGLLLDELRLRQILLNLLGNAVKFTDSGSIRLTVNCRFPEGRESSTIELRLCVADTGLGIAAEQQTAIFDAFEQQKGVKWHRYGGTGLGLAITKRIVEMMGGEIQVDSEPGEGSVFTVLFSEVEIAATEAPAHWKEGAHELKNISFAPATILIADDIDYNRELLQSFLAPYGFNILEARHGGEALKQLSACRPDLILLDMKMPEIDGYEVAQTLRKDETYSSIPVVAVTASALKQDEERISTICDGYLRKPVSQRQLILELKKFLPHTIIETHAPQQMQDELTPSEPFTMESLLSSPELVAELKTFISQLEEALEVMEINEIQELILKIAAIAKEHQHSALLSWTTLAQEALSSFDTRAISKSVNSFLTMFERLP